MKDRIKEKIGNRKGGNIALFPLSSFLFPLKNGVLL
jgi:hypothetical protein